MLDPGPSGRRQPAPGTASHHGASATRWLTWETTAPGTEEKATPEAVTRLDQAWDRLVAHLTAVGEVVREEPRATGPELRAAGYAYLLNLTNAALEQEFFSADPVYCEHGPLQDPTKRYATESPDCLFGVTTLDPAGTYRITGRPTGAVRPPYLGVTLYRGMDLLGVARQAEDATGAEDFRAAFAAATGATRGSISSPGGLTLENDGSFAVVLSADPQPGNWLAMPEDVNHVITRQYFYDWETEEAYHPSVERLDRPSGGPAPTPPDSVARRLERTGDLVEGFARFWRVLYRTKEQAKRNVLVTEPPLQDGYAGDTGYIAYGGGYLEIGDDEAAVVEFSPPECHFWNIQLGDLWGQSLDYTWRQSHLNGHMARAAERRRAVLRRYRR